MSLWGLEKGWLYALHLGKNLRFVRSQFEGLAPNSGIS